jgi:B-cell receptor-associated protein 31
MLILLGLMAVLESVVVFLLSSGIEPMVAIGRAALGILKSKTGSTLAKAVSAAFVVLFASNISNVFRVQKRIAKIGASQADQSIIRSQLLEITLIGYCLLLGLMMTSLDSFLKQVDALTRNINVLKKQAKGAQEEYLRLQSEQQNSKKSKDEELAAAMEIKSLKDVVSDLRNKLERLQLDANSKEKEVKVLKVSMRALEKQTEGFRLEYIRLMDDNESLRNQLTVFDRKHSTLESKKNS